VFDVPRFAVIQDGTELARQTDADITGCYEECSELLSADGTPFAVTVFTDEAVGFLLDRIDPGEYQCLVIASNALNSGQVEQAVERRKTELRRYLDRGGGIVVLHQATESLAAVLPEDLCPDIVDRASERGRDSADSAVPYDADDVLLHYPATVAVDRFFDGGFAVGPPSLFYKDLRAESLPETLKPVLVYGDEVLVARTYDHVPERVVVATLPLDWQRAVDLLSNAIRYAALGGPRRLVWRQEGASRRQMLIQWLSLDGGASVRPMPGEGDALGPTERWLLENVDMVVVPPSCIDAVKPREEVHRFLDLGGTLLSTDDVAERSGSEVRAFVGAYTERLLATRLYGELRAVRGWEAVDFAFELRNIVTALAFLATNPANRTRAAVSTEELKALKEAVRERLRDERHREDLSSSIAHVQSLAFLSGDTPVDHELLDWMAGDPRRERFDVGIQIRAVTALGLRRPDPGFADAALQALRDQAEPASLAPVVRVLDAVAVVDQAGMFEGDHDVVRELTELVCDLLEQQPPEPGVGWLSVEATADVTRGLIALLNWLPVEDTDLAARVTDRVGAAITVLRQAFRRYERNRKAVAWLARLTHAVVLVDRRFPIGLQRLASLEWPGTSPEEMATGGAERSLLEHLAVENKTLRDRENEFEDAQLAARIGRGAATLGATAAVAVPFVYVLVQVGFESIWALLGNVTVLLTALLGIVAGLFTLLGRWHLLAGPAVKVLDWIGEAVPLLSGLSKLRRK